MKAKRVKKLDPAGRLDENAARIVRVRLRELRSFVPRALDPAASVAQHDMRIAAKRLRYVLEATELCFGNAGPAARRRAKDLQDVLGEMHDCDVMLPQVREHARSLRSADADVVRGKAGDAADLEPRLAARAPHRTAYRGLDVLSIYLQARRELLFDRFTELWAEQEERGTWDALERAAGKIVGEAKRRRAERRKAERAARELEQAEQAEQEAAERARQAAESLSASRRRLGGFNVFRR